MKRLLFSSPIPGRPDSCPRFGVQTEGSMWWDVCNQLFFSDCCYPAAPACSTPQGRMPPPEKCDLCHAKPIEGNWQVLFKPAAISDVPDAGHRSVIAGGRRPTAPLTRLRSTPRQRSPLVPGNLRSLSRSSRHETLENIAPKHAPYPISEYLHCARGALPFAVIVSRHAGQPNGHGWPGE